MNPVHAAFIQGLGYRDEACNSPTLFAVANVIKNKVLWIRSRKEAEDNGSNGDDLKKFKTVGRSQEGGRTSLTGAST